MWIFSCVARVDNTIATEAELMCTIRSIQDTKPKT